MNNESPFKFSSSFSQQSSTGRPVNGLSGDEDAAIGAIIQGVYNLLRDRHCSCCRYAHPGSYDRPQDNFNFSRREAEGQTHHTISGVSLYDVAPHSYHYGPGSGTIQSRIGGLPNDFRIVCNTVPKTHLIAECQRLNLPPPTFTCRQGSGGVGAWEAACTVPWDITVFRAVGGSKGSAEEKAAAEVFRKYHIQYPN